MKVLMFALLFLTVLFFGFRNGYSEDSGVIVIGSSETPVSGSASSDSESQDPSGSDVNEFVPAPLYEISGSKIGNTKVSQEVILPSAAEVMFVDGGISGAFSMVRVEAGGKEIQVLNMSPERSVGHKLPKGTYKVYPEDPDDRFPLDKLSAKVQVKLIEGTTGGTQ
jgi:hypothetical protein